MTKKNFFILIIIISLVLSNENSFNCEQFTSDDILMHANWEILKRCLPTIAQQNVNEKVAANVWNLIKDANNGLDNIEAETFKVMGDFVTKIPIDDLINIIFNEIDIIATFGRAKGFDGDEKLKLIAEKIKIEWTNKNPEMFSQYDLEILGQILCYFKGSDISRIHSDAFKGAAKTIGSLTNCPVEILQEFAKLAVQSNAFGSPNKWGKVDINLIGNVINGLESTEYALINPEVLQEINALRRKNSRLNKKNLTLNVLSKKDSF